MTIQQRRTRAGSRPRADRAPGEVYYPESDGKPMAETPIHRDEMMRLIQTLQDAFAARVDVYVSGNMMCYYEEGNPRLSVSPDVFVTTGTPKAPERRVYKMWEEGPPTVVIEVTSRSTRREDLVKKRGLYARLGVREYFLYDPLAEYLRPPLQGLRLEGGEYRAIEPDAAGALVSAALDLRLVLVEGRLRLRDRRTDAELLSPAEARRAEAARADAEAAARQAAERRIAELEALLARRREP